MRSRLSVALCACLAIFSFGFLFMSGTALAASKFWVGGSADWDNAANWSVTSGGTGGAGQPADGDNVYLTQSDAADIVVNYANATIPDPTLNQVTIDATGTGSITLQQASDPLTIGAFYYIGDTGQGAVNHTGGNTTGISSMVVGQQATATGTYALGGTGSLSALRQIIGAVGTGTFTQTGGSNNVGSSGLWLGSSSGDGTYDLSGGTVNANLTVVGGSGTGNLIHTGGTFTVATSDLILGSSVAGVGTYDLGGTGLLRADLNINTREIIGRWGTGTFTQTGGENRTIELILGQYSGSIGTYNLDGGTLRGTVTVGEVGTGIFNHTGGTYAEGGIIVGATGTYSLSGGQITKTGFGATVEGSFLQTGGTNTIGGITVKKTGSYELSGSSVLSVSGIAVGTSPGDDASFTQLAGTTTVTGDLRVASGSSTAVGSFNLEAGDLSVNNEYVGWSGRGTFTQNGGAHTVTHALRIGDLDSGDGSYFMNSGSLTATEMEIGGSISHSGGGTGVFTQTGGTVDIASAIRIGTSGSLGAGGQGTMNIAGGTLKSSSGGIGGGDATGAVTVSGGGVWDNTNTVGTNAGSIGVGNGSLTVADTGRVIATTVRAWGATAVINGDGTIEANVENFNGGTVAPGLSGSGALSIIGDYSQETTGQGLPDGTLAIEIGGTLAGTGYDVLNVSGTAFLAGTLDVDLFDMGSGLFAPSLGESFDILTAGILQGKFDVLNLAALGNGLDWQVDYFTDFIGTTDIVRLSVVSAVPLPASAWLFGSGLLGLAGISRGRKTT